MSTQTASRRGATETRLLQTISKEMIEAIRAAIPKGRLAKIDDIVPAYVFLASDEARHFVGQCLSPTVATLCFEGS